MSECGKLPNKQIEVYEILNAETIVFSHAKLLQ